MVHPQSMLQIQGKTNVNSFQCYCAPPNSVVGFNAESSSETQKINFKKAEHYPTITLSISQVLIPIQNINARWKLEGPVTTEAYLTLAGMKRKIDLLVTISQHFGNVYRFTAKKSLLLTDFGITPPTVLMGMVKVKNEIILDIDLYISAYSPPTS